MHDDDTTQPITTPDPDEPRITLGLYEKAFFAGMIAAQLSAEAIAKLPEATKDSFAGDQTGATVTGLSGLGGTPALAAFFWMMIGARMVIDLPALMTQADQADQADRAGEADGASEARDKEQPSRPETLIDLQQLFLHGAMTRAPSWLRPAFELTIPSFEAQPFLDRDGNRVDSQALRRLVEIALQRTWMRVGNGDTEGPVYLDGANSVWEQVGTFRLRDGW